MNYNEKKMINHNRQKKFIVARSKSCVDLHRTVPLPHSNTNTNTNPTIYNYPPTKCKLNYSFKRWDIVYPSLVISNPLSTFTKIERFRSFKLFPFTFR
jgi:hypothetical protein